MTDERLWSPGGGDRAALLAALRGTLRYLRSPRAAAAYARLAARGGPSRSRVIRSQERFAQLLRGSPDAATFESAVAREFERYTPAGAAPTLFTGYCEPEYAASRYRGGPYRYPLYRLPPAFTRWPRPHPNRLTLEGVDGFGADPRLRGHEIAWLADRLDAFLVHVEGTARLRLTDGRVQTVAYAAHTDRPYSSIGQMLVRDGKIPADRLTGQTLRAHFRAHPDDLAVYLPRNPRFVFFREAPTAPPRGSLGLPLPAERAIATDKAIMPPGALARIEVTVSNPESVAVLGADMLTRYVLDMDVGGAIKGAARVDVFMGTGRRAEERAGALNSPGRLSYLLLRAGAAGR